MDKIISLLTNLFNLTKVVSVTLPGLVASAAIVILFWPPPPSDLIPIVTHAATPSTQYKGPYDKACDTEENTLAEAAQLSQVKQTAKTNQSALDEQKNKFAQCIEIEASWTGKEKTENDQLTADLANLETERLAAQTNLLAYEKSNSPLKQHYQLELRVKERAINDKRAQFLENESSIRERARRQSELTRDVGIISDRLADPGRLRPRRAFDDYLSALVNHVVAFILLALAIGIVMTAVNRMIYAVAFETLFKGF